MPIVWSQKIENDGELAVWKISETADQLFQKLQLNQSEKTHYETLNKGARHLHWLGSRVLLRTLLNTSTFIELNLDANNKPFLGNFPYHISISHSNEMAAVIICKEKAVGIDIEKMSEKIFRIKERFLSPIELLFIDPNNAMEQLYVCWGIKEALFKLYGKGNLPFINSIQISPFDYRNENFAYAKIVKPNFEKTYKVWYLKFEDYMLCWVSE